MTGAFWRLLRASRVSADGWSTAYPTAAGTRIGLFKIGEHF
jgi:hypothetical protein